MISMVEYRKKAFDFIMEFGRPERGGQVWILENQDRTLEENLKGLG